MNVQIATKLLWELNELSGRDYWSRQRLQAHQAHALHSLREFAYTHTPFYRRFHKGKTNRPLNELPVLTKDVLMENFDQIMTDRSVRLSEVQTHVSRLRGDEHFRGQYWVSTTPGNTGQHGLILFDDAEWTTTLAAFARAHQWAGMQAGIHHHMKLASVAATAPWQMTARIGATLASRYAPALRLDSNGSLDVIVQALNEQQPEMLIVYPSMGGALAEEQVAGRLRISPQLIFIRGEVLTDATRWQLEAVWGRRLFNQYAVTESGELAAECGRHAGMHLHEDLVIIEVVDEHNRPVPPGVHGDKVLVTALYKRAQPLIRYEISDSLRLAAAPCPCGRPFRLIDNIRARSEEISYFTSTERVPVAVHPNVPHRVMEPLPVV